MVRFGSVFGQKISEPMKSSLVQFGLVFTIFQRRNLTKLVSLVRVGSVCLKIQLKKIHIFINLYLISCIQHTQIFYRALFSMFSIFETALYN